MQFPKGGVAKWQRADGELQTLKWPKFLVDVDKDTDDELEGEELTVAARLKTCTVLSPTFLVAVDTKKDTVGIRVLVGSDEFAGAVNDVVRVNRAFNWVHGRKVVEPFDFDSTYARAVRAEIDGVHVTVVALDDLVALKRAAGRAKDKEDVRVLLALTGKSND